MLANTLIYVGAALPLFWGIAHLFPTKSVVRGFGDIGADNKNIITMEWIVEGVALIFIGSLVILVTAIDSANIVSQTVYIASSVCLVVLAIISLMTGFKIHFLPFKLCPVLFITSATFITSGWIMLSAT